MSSSQIMPSIGIADGAVMQRRRLDQTGRNPDQIGSHPVAVSGEQQAGRDGPSVADTSVVPISPVETASPHPALIGIAAADVSILRSGAYPEAVVVVTTVVTSMVSSTVVSTPMVSTAVPTAVAAASRFSY